LIDSQNAALKAANDQFIKEREQFAKQMEDAIKSKEIEMNKYMNEILTSKNNEVTSLFNTVATLKQHVQEVTTSRDKYFEDLQMQKKKLNEIEASLAQEKVIASNAVKLLEITTGVEFETKVDADGKVKYTVGPDGNLVVKKGAAPAYAEKGAKNLIQEAYGLGVFTRVRGSGNLQDRYVLDNQVNNQAKENARKFLIDYFAEIWDYNDKILARPLSEDEASRRNEARFKFINEHLDTWDKVASYYQRAESNPSTMLNEYNSVLQQQQNGGAPGLQNYAKAKAEFNEKYGLNKALDHKINPNDLLKEYFTNGVVTTSGGFRKATKK
jgi:hypothetical protein